MKQYTVLVREVHISPRIVYANSPEEAIREICENGGEEEMDLEYSHTEPVDTWSVLDDRGKEVISYGTLVD